MMSVIEGKGESKGQNSPVLVYGYWHHILASLRYSTFIPHYNFLVSTHALYERLSVMQGLPEHGMA